MISHHIRLEDWQKGFDLVRSREAVKIIITKDEEKLSQL
jgi:threonine dehydrogenase-like Zn-dependent dehydrogenase